MLLCAGPDSCDRSLTTLFRNNGIYVDIWDIENGKSFYFADDAHWDPLIARVHANDFDGVFVSPPCSTHSRLCNKPGGPPPLRGITVRARHGLPNLTTVPQKEFVRLRNLLSRRVAAVLRHMEANDRIFLFEIPGLIDGVMSMLRLDEYLDYLAMQNVTHAVDVQ